MSESGLPDFGKVLQGAVNRAVDALVTGYGEQLDGLGGLLTGPVRLVEAGLLQLPVWLGVVLVAVAAWLGRREVLFAAAMAALPLALALLGVWLEAMQSLALIVVAVSMVVLLGLPLGIAAARLPRVSRVLAPVYDLMQTIPSFVYLIPVAMVLGLGRAPALVATLIYALPPFARLSELGLRAVDGGLVQASRALGLGRVPGGDQAVAVPRLAIAAATPPAPCGMLFACRAISTEPSVASRVAALKWPIWAMRKALPV